MFGLRGDNRRERLTVLAALHKQETEKLALVGGDSWAMHSEAYWLLNALATSPRLAESLVKAINELEDVALANQRLGNTGRYNFQMSLARELTALL